MDIGSDIIRGYIDLMILRTLWENDSYGYEISKTITEIAQNRYSMKETTLYSAFARLEKLRCLSSYPGSVSGGRMRTYYTLTPEGRQYYRQKCAEWALAKELIAKFILEEETNDGSHSNLSG